MKRIPIFLFLILGICCSQLYAQSNSSWYKKQVAILQASKGLPLGFKKLAGKALNAVVCEYVNPENGTCTRAPHEKYTQEVERSMRVAKKKALHNFEMAIRGGKGVNLLTRNTYQEALKKYPGQDFSSLKKRFHFYLEVFPSH